MAFQGALARLTLRGRRGGRRGFFRRVRVRIRAGRIRAARSARAEFERSRQNAFLINNRRRGPLRFHQQRGYCERLAHRRAFRLALRVIRPIAEACQSQLESLAPKRTGRLASSMRTIITDTRETGGGLIYSDPIAIGGRGEDSLYLTTFSGVYYAPFVHEGEWADTVLATHSATFLAAKLAFETTYRIIYQRIVWSCIRRA